MLDDDSVDRFDLLELSTDDYWTILKCGVLIAILAYMGAGALASATSTKSWLCVIFPPLAGILYAVWMIVAARGRLTPQQRTRLTGLRALLQEKERLESASHSAAADAAAIQARINALLDFALRMKRLDAVLLADRIAETETLVGTFERLLAVTRELIAGIDHEQELLEVEIDARGLLAHDAEEALRVRVAELAEDAGRVEEWRRVRAAALELEGFLAAIPRSSPALDLLNNMPECPHVI